MAFVLEHSRALRRHGASSLKALRDRHGAGSIKQFSPLGRIISDYLVVGIDDDYFRVLDDVGEPILYPSGLFDIIDHSIPDDWIHRKEAFGRTYVDPPECSAPGFYEDYFDGKHSAIATFQDVLRRL